MQQGRSLWLVRTPASEMATAIDVAGEAPGCGDRRSQHCQNFVLSFYKYENNSSSKYRW